MTPMPVWARLIFSLSDLLYFIMRILFSTYVKHRQIAHPFFSLDGSTDKVPINESRLGFKLLLFAKKEKYMFSIDHDQNRT